MASLSTPTNQQKQTVFKWDKESTLKLIDMYEGQPELWNCPLKEYRDRDKKAKAIQNIANVLNTSEAEVGRKWHNLRCQMNSELRKIKKTKSGDEANDREWKSNWEFYDALQFMMGCSGDTKSTATLDTVSSEDKNFLEELQSDNVNKPLISSQTPSKKLKSKATNTEVENDKALKKALNILNTESDDYTVFGEYVACELRQLRSAERKRRLKRIIQKAILQMSEEDETEFYGSTTATPLMSPNAFSYPFTSNSVGSFQEVQIINTTTTVPPITQYYENYLPEDNQFLTL